MIKFFHFHGKFENTSFVYTIWFCNNLTTAWLHYLLHNCESETDAITIHFSRALQFAKTIEEFAKVFFSNAFAWVFNMDDQQIVRLASIACFDLYKSICRKLDGISKKIGHDLL